MSWWLRAWYLLSVAGLLLVFLYSPKCSQYKSLSSYRAVGSDVNDKPVETRPTLGNQPLHQACPAFQTRPFRMILDFGAIQEEASQAGRSEGEGGYGKVGSSVIGRGDAVCKGQNPRGHGRSIESAYRHPGARGRGKGMNQMGGGAGTSEQGRCPGEGAGRPGLSPAADAQRVRRGGRSPASPTFQPGADTGGQ